MNNRIDRRHNVHYIFWTTYGLLVAAVAVAGFLVGTLFAYTVDLPRVEELQKNQPGTVSYVYSDDGRVLGQFALEKRILLSYEQIPETIKKAILAAEDASFFEHSGIDFRRLLITVVRDIIYGERKGASTLTMQLSKMRFTSPEKTPARKIKDFLYAIDIEKNYSKEQIFAFYCNQVPLGHGNYGMAAAARAYFGKPLKELTISESALLAGLIQLPARYSPIIHLDSAVNRRNWVLSRMREENFISQTEYEEALEEKMMIQDHSYQESPAPYFVEWVRQYLGSQYQSDLIWEGGLRIFTTVDYDMQIAAQRALRDGVKDFDKSTRGWVGPVRNIFDDGQQIEDYSHPDWAQIFTPGQMIHGVVLEANEDSAEVSFGNFRSTITPEEIQWTGRSKVSDVLKRGDVAVFSLKEVRRSENLIEAELDQIPEVQGAVLSIENRTGEIKSMVGGFDFEYSKFNRATQALRQPGSVFKPFTFVAALEEGFSPFDQVLDSPVEFLDALGRPYSPSNSDGEFRGLITIRQALAASRNIPTVRLANALGPSKIAAVARRFGIDRDFEPYLSLALGSVEVTLQEMVSAFTAFPNHGVRPEPYFIKRVEDSNGILLEENRPLVHDEVLSPEIADQMIYMLEGVVQFGTSTQAKELERPVAGKTGTTNDSTDSWFIGFVPQLTSGVWVGYDEKRSLGSRVFGATLALPIWTDYMKEAVRDLPVEEFELTSQIDSSSVARVLDLPGDSELDQDELPAEEPYQPSPSETAPASRETEEKIQVEDIVPPERE